MTYDFDPSTAVVENLSACAPGSVGWPLVRGANPQLVLVLDAEHPDQFAAVDLAGGEYQFVIRRGLKRSVQAAFFPVATASIRVELPGPSNCSSNVDAVGSILVGADGMFLIVRGGDINGFQGAEYVSLRDWTVRDHLPSAHLVFPSWRLTTSDVSRSDRRVLVTHGEW